MPSQTENADILRKLLPQGEAWNWLLEQQSDHVFDQLLVALAGEPARLETDAENWLESVIPDNALTDLDHFEKIVGVPDEDLTDAERLARIQAFMFGRQKVNRGYLEGVIQAMAGDTGVFLFSRAYDTFAAGVATAGDTLASGAWDFTWRCELYPNLLGTHPGLVGANADVFNSGWSNFSAVTANFSSSPVSNSGVADRCLIFDSSPAVHNFATAPDDDATVTYVLWAYPETAGVRALKVGFRGKDAVDTLVSYPMEGQRWHRIEHTASIGAGSGTAAVLLQTDGVTPERFQLSWSLAGQRNTSLEARIRALMPLHTRGVFSIQGEWSSYQLPPEESNK